MGVGLVCAIQIDKNFAKSVLLKPVNFQNSRNNTAAEIIAMK